MRKIFSFLFCLLIFSVFLFAEDKASIDVLSPVEGVWYNKQQLVINQTDGNEYYFSLNDEDPFISGFAYDGPILLEIEGDVTLRIKDSKGTEKNIKYTVINDDNNSLSYSDFIQSFSDTGDINYICGNSLDIPQTLNYSIDFPGCNNLQGRSICLSEKTNYTETIPVVISDKSEEKKWRFMMYIYPQTYGQSKNKTVPFEISDWTKLSFTDKNLIYRVDDNYWQGFDKSFELDRTVSHTISWQSINYEKGNPIESFVLPPENKIIQTSENGLIKIGFENNDDNKYQLSQKSYSSSSSLYQNIYIDAFTGQQINKQIELDVYYDSVYQGTCKNQLVINKTVPSKPEFITSNNSFRVKDLTVKTVCNNDCRLYISVSEPFPLSDIDDDIDSDFYNTLDVRMSDFLDTCSNEFESKFSLLGSESCFYKIKAYCSNGINSSDISEYSFVVENNEYYVNESSVSSKMDGTKKYPFNSLQYCLDYTKELKNPVIKLIGPVKINDDIVIENNCVIKDYDDSEIFLGKESTIYIENAKVIFQNCSFQTIIDDETYNTSVVNSFIINDSTVTFENTLISADYDKNGIFINADNSTINFIKDSICSVSADNFVSFIIATSCDIIIDSSIISGTALTSSLISMDGCRLSLSDNTLSVSGNIGRICELLYSDLIITGNEFRSKLEDMNKSSSIFMDEESAIIKDNNNEYYGF